MFSRNILLCKKNALDTAVVGIVIMIFISFSIFFTRYSLSLHKSEKIREEEWKCFNMVQWGWRYQGCSATFNSSLTASMKEESWKPCGLNTTTHFYWQFLTSNIFFFYPQTLAYNRDQTKFVKEGVWRDGCQMTMLNFP